jgi:hypothetical protein
MLNFSKKEKKKKKESDEIFENISFIENEILKIN